MSFRVQEQEIKLAVIEALNQDLDRKLAASTETEKYLRDGADRLPALQARIESLSMLEAEVKGKEDLIVALRTQLDSLHDLELDVKRKDKQIQNLQEDIQTHRDTETSFKTTIDNLQDVKEQVGRLQVEAAKAGLLEVDLAAVKGDLEKEKTERIRAAREAELVGKRFREKEQELISMEGQ